MSLNIDIIASDLSLNIFLKYYHFSRSALLLIVQGKIHNKKVVFAMKQNIYRTKQRYFAWKQENDPAELTEISFRNKNALGKN